MPDQTKGMHKAMLPSRVRLPRLSVVGLGKLGAPMAAVFAGAGFEVVGADKNEQLVDLISRSEAPFEEKGLAEALSAASDKLRATTNIADATLASDATFVIVPTPTDNNGMFDNSYLLAALAEIGAALALKDSYHLVVITSTVMPGSTGLLLKETLEARSGKAVGREIGLCYSPEFIALGSVIRDMKNPDLLLIGESDKKAGDMLESIYRQSVESSPQCRRMGFVNAELAKIAINTFVTTKISYINMLSAICDQLEGGDIDAVSAALGTDSRIGSKYLKGGAAYGGPCFPRDNKALAAFANSVGVDARIAAATDKINDDQISRLLAFLAGLAQGVTVSVMGLSYKTDTPVFEESAGLKLVEALVDNGNHVKVYDPMAKGLASLPEVDECDNMYTVLESSEAVFLMTAWSEFGVLPDLLKQVGRPRLVVDPWRMFDQSQFADQVTYIAVGRPQPE